MRKRFPLPTIGNNVNTSMATIVKNVRDKRFVPLRCLRQTICDNHVFFYTECRAVLYDISPIPPMQGKSRAYFEAISVLPKHPGVVLINARCIGYMLAKNN